MRITVVTGPFLPVPPAPCGAVERIWNDLAVEIARRGHDVTLIHRAHPALPPGKEQRQGVLYHPIGGYTSTRRTPVNLAKDLGYAGRVLAALPPADILVTNSFWLPVLAGRLRRRAAGKLHVHIARVPKGQMKLYVNSGIDRLAAVSSAIKKFITEEYPQAGEITKVFPNPIDTAVFVPPAQPRVYSGPRTLLYTGRIHPEKGLDLLIDGYRLFREQHPDAELTLRLIGPWRVEDGGGGEEFVARLKSLAKGQPIDFRDPIYDRAELARALQEAHFYIYPSQAERGEASPVAPLEAMATGLVPIVSDLPQFFDYLTDGETGVVFNHRGSGGAAAISGAIERLYYADPQALSAWSHRAATRGAQFSVADVAQRYLEDFEELKRGTGNRE